MLFQQEHSLFCPFCGELIDVLVDELSGPQSYYEDCSVCCSPILFIITENDAGEIFIDTKRDDE
jgi:Cysteine-rich CPXCG